MKNYDIYVSVNGGSYSLWQSATTATSADYTGVSGSTYRFYSRARDNANNLEAAPASPDAVTTIALPQAAPLGWWKLDETSGSTVTDSSGNNNNGTLVGATRVAGLSGNALSFDGVDDYVSLPNSIVNTAAGSIAMWVKTGTNFTDLAHLFNTSSTNTGDGLGSHSELHLNFNANEQLQFFIEGGSTDVNITSASSYADNAWHHVAATWDINGNAVLYVDGVAVGSAVHDAFNFVGSSITYLGRPGAATRYYNGMIDDVRLYNVALSSSEVAALAAMGGQSGSLRAAGLVPEGRRLFSRTLFEGPSMVDLIQEIML